MKCERCGARGEVRKIGLYARLPGPIDGPELDAVMQDLECGAVCEICTTDIITKWTDQLNGIAINTGWELARTEEVN